MNETWSYGLATGWQRLDSDPLDSVQPNEGAYSEIMRRAGYVGGHSSDVNCPSATIWEAGGDTDITRKYPFVIDLNLNEANAPCVWCEDLPSLLAVLPAVAALVQWGQLGGIQYTIEEFCSRAFRAFHGHSLIDVCPQCDPHEFKQRQEAARKRKERKAQ